MRVATFNLLHGRRVPDGVAHPEDLKAAARALDADLVALQEVDRSQDRSGCVDQASVVAEALGARWWRFVPALEGTPGGAWSPSSVDDGSTLTGPAYGIALLSRHPVRSWQVRRFGPAPVGMPLHVAGRRGLVAVADEPRVAVAAEVDTPSGPLTVIATHLSFVPGWNVRQLRSVIRALRAMPAPRLLLADLNLPGGLASAFSGWRRLGQRPTYPSPTPRLQFDHILLDPRGGAVVPPVVAVTTPVVPVSDHRPLVVEL